MKNILTSIIVISILSSCKKEDIPVQPTINNYISNGNLLILQVSQEFEGAAEYDLPSVNLNNGSLPISSESEPYISETGDNEANLYWKFNPNNDTIFQITQNRLTYKNNFIPTDQFLPVNTSVPFLETEFQDLGWGNNTNLETIWSKVSNLDVVRTYRQINPFSKVGIMRRVVSEHDTELGITVPSEKYLLLMSK